MHMRTKCRNKRYGSIFASVVLIGVICIVFVVLWKVSVQMEEALNREWSAVNGQPASDAMLVWLEQEVWETRKMSQLGIVSPETSEVFQIDLAEGDSSGICFEMMMGQQLQISGKRDAGRGYFEGNIAWEGQEICIMNFRTKEYAVLKQNTRSFILGDYYVSCRYDAEDSEIELLIFYCPA